MKTIEFCKNDIITLCVVIVVQVVAGWSMYFFEVVYAPLPMFAAAIAGGLMLKGSLKSASVIGALAGLIGGSLSEVAYHFVRVKKVITWMQMTPTEHFWLGVAEAILYASLLSFFMAFFSWSAQHDNSNRKLFPGNKNENDDSASSIEVPMFKYLESEEDDESD